MTISRFAIVLGSTALILGGCANEEPSEKIEQIRPVLSMIVADPETVRVSTYPGRAQALRELNIGFEVPGKMLDRPVDVGTDVKAGDIVAVLDPKPYAARVKSLEGQRAALEANLENAKLDLARSQELLKSNFASQARVDDQIALVASTEANIDATQGALDEARLNLSYTKLVAPFDAKIAATFIENFQNVNARQPVLRLLDTSRIEMEIAVPEMLIRFEKYVENIEVEFTSLPGVKIPATIARVGNEASTSTRTYPVTIVMDQPAGATIQPGMAGRATAQVKLPDNWQDIGAQVPASAVFSPNTDKPSDKFIWVVNPETNKVEAKAVEVRSFNERGFLVSGLNTGDRIVVAGANTLTAGQEVRVEVE